MASPAAYLILSGALKRLVRTGLQQAARRYRNDSGRNYDMRKARNRRGF